MNDVIAANVPNPTSSSINPSVLISLANQDRAAQGLSSVAENPVLTAIAQDKANDMAAKGYFAHTSPDGKSPWYWFDQERYVYSYAGENLAVDFTDTNSVETAWMNSPEHRANLLNSKYAQVGIAVAVGTYEGHQTIFVAEEFGTPKAAPAVVHPVTPPAATVTIPTLATRPTAAPLTSKALTLAKAQPIAPTAKVLGGATAAPEPTAPGANLADSITASVPVVPSSVPLYMTFGAAVAGLLLTLAVLRPLHRAALAKRR